MFKLMTINPRIALRNKALRSRLLQGIILSLFLFAFSISYAQDLQLNDSAPSPSSTSASAASAASISAIDNLPTNVVATDASTQNADATVMLFNRPIITFRAPLLGMSPQSRAKRASFMMHDRLSNPGQHQVSTVDNAIGTIVKMDDEVMFFVVNDDADKLLEQSPEAVVKASVAALNKAILESKQSRDIEFMSNALFIAIVATFVALALLWLLTRAKKILQIWCLRIADRYAHKNGESDPKEQLRSALAWLIKNAILAMYWFVFALICYEWFSLVLAQFPQTRAWGEQLNVYLLNIAGHFGHAILNSLPDLFTALIIFMLAKIVVRGLKGFFDGVEAGRIKLDAIDADVANTTRRIASVLLWLFAFAMAYPYLPGSDTEAFKGISVLVGLMLSLGASSLVSQAGSGLILTYTRMFRRGEYVNIGNHEGTVVELGMFTTRIRTGLGVELALPNSLILANVTKNYSRAVQGSGFMVDATVTIGYDTPWRQVHAMLIEAAIRTQGVLAQPAPRVYQIALTDYYPEYRLVCQAIPSEPRPRAEVISNLHANIQDVFNEYGVQILSPHYFDDPKAPKIVPVKDWYKAPASHQTSTANSASLSVESSENKQTNAVHKEATQTKATRTKTTQIVDKQAKPPKK
jgi:small-conductance mechanosensitive channel